MLFVRPVFMFMTSKQIVLPSFVTLTTDAYNSVHLRLSGNVHKGKFIHYFDELMKSQDNGNDGTVSYDAKTKAIWVHLNAKCQESMKIVSHLCNQEKKFTVHHGLGEDISLYRWMLQNHDLVPPFSSFYISCGALLIKDDHVMLVQERNGSRKGEYGIPGGRADSGESIATCVQRQLFEQTGIKAKYKYILHFRELSGTLFGASDIYFACVMEFDEVSLKDLKICERQLSDVKWVHLKEYHDFSAQNAVGTQKELAKYITQLYERGFDFNNSANEKLPNYTQARQYISQRDNIQREFVEHFLASQFKMPANL